MEKRNIIIVVIVLILAIAVAVTGFFLINQAKIVSFDDKFSMEVPASAEFIRNGSSEDVVSFKDLKNEIFVSYIETNSLTNIFAAGLLKKMFETQEVLHPEDTGILHNTTFYRVHLENFSDYEYIAVYNPSGIYIIVGSNDINQLVDLMKSIKLTSVLNNNETNSTFETVVSYVDTNDSKNNNESMEDLDDEFDIDNYDHPDYDYHYYEPETSYPSTEPDTSSESGSNEVITILPFFNKILTAFIF
ncbi:hypothetical protein [Methanobrevibacter sp. DSM 116169]|uniref:hypothetical protein n=1 Tax=Methanobrevibacter sp. DSM 116169 TaxID=3242727 RepID=UPI0038FC09A1